MPSLAMRPTAEAKHSLHPQPAGSLHALSAPETGLSNAGGALACF